tara:strand:- start:12 stop:533 length:522 start_codon:yes stop_codon:yes gene_type:complete
MGKSKKSTKKTTSKSTSVSRKKKLESIEKLNEIEQGKVVTIPDDAIINVPISGSFKKAVEETLHYVMADLDTEEIIIALQRIRTGFKGVKAGEATHTERAIWVLMSLISEMNYQAAEQKKTIVTDEEVNEKMSDIINAFDDPTSTDAMQNYNQEYKDWRSEYDKKKEEGSNED